jgi:hypothetical protein
MFFPPFVSLGQTNVFRGASRPGAHHSLPALAPPVAVVVVDQVSTLRNRLDCSTWGNRAWYQQGRSLVEAFKTSTVPAGSVPTASW